MRTLICIFLICAACLWKTVIKLKGYRFSVQATLNKWLWTWFFKSVNVGWVISGLVPGQSWEHHHKTQMGYNQHSSRQHRVPADPYRRHTSLNRSLNAQCFTYDSHKCRRSYNHTHTPTNYWRQTSTVSIQFMIPHTWMCTPSPLHCSNLLFSLTENVSFFPGIQSMCAVICGVVYINSNTSECIKPTADHSHYVRYNKVCLDFTPAVVWEPKAVL